MRSCTAGRHTFHAEMHEVIEIKSDSYKYKGSVETMDALPTTDNSTGDVYKTVDTGKYYSWIEGKWEIFGSGGGSDIKPISIEEIDEILGF